MNAQVRNHRPMRYPAYRALISSDWNECLAPCGPFDVITYSYPRLETAVSALFKQYTANRISLAAAVHQISDLLPGPITQAHMDRYLDQAFSTYNGVAALIEACRANNILFMVNTTGMVGYFQRASAKGLLPPIPFLCAHPLVSFPGKTAGLKEIMTLTQTSDKAKSTSALAQRFNIPAGRIIIMGDSGGDGPHFQWGAAHGAHLVGVMTKPSLTDYCIAAGIAMDHHFGVTYLKGEARDAQRESGYDYMMLMDIFEAVIARQVT